MLVFQLKDNEPTKASKKQGPCLAIKEIITYARACNLEIKEDAVISLLQLEILFFSLKLFFYFFMFLDYFNVLMLKIIFKN